MPRFALFAAVTAVTAALVACQDDDDIVCTDLAAASVNLTVVDEAGAAIPGATATYSLNGGAPVACDGPYDGQFVCGYEIAGDLLVRAEAPGYEAVEQTVTVGADECHVIGEQVTFTLPEVACTEEERPSIEVTVAGASGEALSGVVVTYAPSGGDDDRPCTAAGDFWVCGWEEAGDFVVVASADGHETQVANVTVEADFCHVITEQVDFALEWLPD